MPSSRSTKNSDRGRDDDREDTQVRTVQGDGDAATRQGRPVLVVTAHAVLTLPRHRQAVVKTWTVLTRGTHGGWYWESGVWVDADDPIATVVDDLWLELGEGWRPTRAWAAAAGRRAERDGARRTMATTTQDGRTRRWWTRRR